MRQEIPAPVIAVVADVVALRETHAQLNALLMHAGAPGDAPEGNKLFKALTWIRRASNDESIDALRFLGKLIAGYMEGEQLQPEYRTHRDRIEAALTESDLRYIKGGRVVGSLGAVSVTLDEMLRKYDFVAVSAEFDRALRNVEPSPREALSAASNILESLCKVIIHDDHLEMPGWRDRGGG